MICKSITIYSLNVVVVSNFKLYSIKFVLYIFSIVYSFDYISLIYKLFQKHGQN